MNTASISSQVSLGDKPSILNLFSYIRDLYQTTDRENDKQEPVQKWALFEWMQLAKADHPAFQLDLNGENGDLLILNYQEVPDLIIPDAIKEWVIIIDDDNQKYPILKQKKERIEKFESSGEREEAFLSFEKEVQGQSLHRIANKEIPAILRDWIEVEVNEEKVFISRRDKTSAFGSDDLRVQMFQAFERVFKQYQEENWLISQSNQLYHQLHQLYFELKAQPQKQLYLSFGHIGGQIGENAYSHHLYHIPLELNLHQKSLHLRANFHEQNISCNPGFASWLDLYFEKESQAVIQGRKKEVLAKADHFNHKRVKLSFEINTLREELYRPAIDLISIFPSVQDRFFKENGEELNWETERGGQKEGIILSFSPEIQLRESHDQLLISKDADAILRRIHSLIRQGKNNKIPDFFNKLFTIPGDSSTEQNHKTKHQEKGNRKKSTFLFPLPYNKEQLSIARRLEDQDAVTVMGPPGTGKSHTIANITSHYVSQGKSVLIVSKNEKALEVVKEKLPSSIQDLAVSLLGNGNFDHNLKYTIDSIKERLSRNYNWDDVIKIENELEETEKATEKLIRHIRQRIGQNDEVKSFFNPISGQEESKSIADWALFVKDSALPLLFIKDHINYNQSTEGLPSLLAQYIELTEGFPSEAHEIACFKYPQTAKFIAPSQFQHVCDRMDALSSILEPEAYKDINIESFTPELERSLEKIKGDLHILNESGRITRHPLFKQHILRDLMERNETHFQLLKNPISDHLIDMGELAQIDPEILLKEVHQLMNKFSGSQTLGIIKKKTLSPQSKKFFDCKVDGIQLKTLNQLSILEAYLSRQYSLKRLRIVMGNYFNSLGISFDPSQLEATLVLLSEILQAIANLEELNRILKKKGFPELNFASRDVDDTLSFLQNTKFFKIYADQAIEVASSIKEIEGAIKEDSTPLMKDLVESLKERDPDKYSQLYAQINKNKVLTEKVRESEKFYEDLKKVLPLTADHLRNRIHEDMAQMTIPSSSIHEQIQSECFILKLINYLDTISDTIGEISRLFEELHQLQRLREKWTAKLIAQQTWQLKSKIITDKERSALTAWRNDLINIGKGHGKNTDRNLRSAIKNMQLAKEAVPIWIMQQETAISFFPDPEPQQFDLLVIDEASQCDISMLNLIFRAKKCMIVGDENQTSVVTKASVFPIERTNQILDRYLHNHPFKQQFNINNRTASIYTLSGVIYPNIVALTEHFRCRPEIIGFSNKYVYNQQISPLKTGLPNPWGPPVESVFVEEEGNSKRKTGIIEAVIGRIEHYIDLFESGESEILPSVGILCLESSNEAHVESLIRSLGRNSRVRKYEEKLNLLVGTSRKFQGDERDIMLLSCTASHSIGKNGNIRAPRAVMGEEMQRIYNVAASRAKEASVLFHSLPPEAIAAMKPNCLRKRLIDYYHDASKPQKGYDGLDQLLKATQSIPGSFKQEVCKYLFELVKEVQILPQYTVGKFVLDFAIIGKKTKMGIFCDGEGSSMYAQELVDQQLILERVGWKIFRVSRLQWYMEEERVKSDLLKWVGKEE